MFFYKKKKEKKKKTGSWAIQTKDKNIKSKGFPSGSVVKNPPASAEDIGSIPDPGRSHTPRSN